MCRSDLALIVPAAVFGVTGEAFIAGPENDEHGLGLVALAMLLAMTVCTKMILRALAHHDVRVSGAYRRINGTVTESKMIEINQLDILQRLVGKKRPTLPEHHPSGPNWPTR